MPNHDARDNRSMLTRLRGMFASSRGVATAEEKAGPTVSSVMFGSSAYGYADDTTPTVADGPLWLNVVVATCLGWLDRNFPVADIEVREIDGSDAVGEIIPDHEFMRLMDAPNTIDTFHAFCASYLLSDVCDGTTVFVKVRDGRDKIHSLWWVPPWDVEIIPSPTKDANRPVSKYRCTIDGYQKEYDPEDVVCIKDGKDPMNHLRGLSKLKAGLRSVATIDRAEMYTQTLMRNCGAISGILSPSTPGEQIDPSNVAGIRGQYATNQTGQNNGKPMVATQGMKFDKLSLSPEEMAVDKIREFPAAAICALIGTPMMAVGLPDPGKTFSNLEQAEYMAWRNGLIPRQERFAEALDKQCPELVDPTRERVVWNRRKITVLNTPLLARLDGLSKAAGGPILTPDEARQFLELGSVPGGDVIATLATAAVTVATPGMEVTAPVVADVAATALNGAQVTSLVEIANAVATGALPADSARALITASFPNLTADQVASIVGPLVSFTPPPPAPAAKSLPPEREDDERPFSVKDQPPKVGPAETETANTYDLPDGKPIAVELRKWFKRQYAEVLGTIPPDMADVPETFADLADYNDPMASAMTPILSAYWQEGGDDERGKIVEATGLDLDEWSVVNPNTKAKIKTAAFDFCKATNDTTSMQLNDALAKLRDELTEGIVEQGESLRQLTKRVQSVFENASTYRAERIAKTESSRAVHAAQEQAAVESEVVVGFEWLASSDACPLCLKVAEEVKRVKLGQDWAVIGKHPAYANVRSAPLHPTCNCTVVHVLLPEYGGPENPEWGETLIQPGAGPSKPEPSVEE